MSNKAKTGGSFVKMAAILAFAGIIVRIIGFFYRLPLTNMIGDEGNGIYSTGYNIYNFFLIMSSAGLPVAISKMISEKLALEQYTNVRKTFKVSMLVTGLLSFAGAVLMVVVAMTIKHICHGVGDTDNMFYKSIWCLYTLAPTVFIVGIMAVFRGFFQGFNTTIPTAMSQLLEQIVHAVFSILLAWLLLDYGVQYGAAGATAGTGIGAFAGLMVLMVYYIITKKSRKLLYKEDKHDYRIQGKREIAINLIKIAVPIITGTAIFSMTNFVDMAMVQTRLLAAGFDNATATVMYGQLNGKYVTLTTMPVAISTAIATAVIPSISASLARKEMDIVRSKIDTALRVTMLISIPAAIGLSSLGSPILKMLFPNYPDGGALITAGGLSVVFLSLSQISTGVLQGIGKVTTPAFNALWGALAKIPVNYVLIAIPQINIIGAVIATTVCYIVCSILNFKALVKATGVQPDYVGMLVKPGIAAVFMGIGAVGSYKLLYNLTSSNTVSTLIAIVFAMVVYFGVLVVIKGFRRDDLMSVPGGTKLIAFLEKINRI